MVKPDPVLLGNTETGMGYAIPELAVISQNDQAPTIFIKSSNRKQVKLPVTGGQNIDNCPVMFIPYSTYYTFRFIHYYICHFLGFYIIVPYKNYIIIIDSSGGICNDKSIYCNLAGSYEIFTASAGTNAAHS